MATPKHPYRWVPSLRHIAYVKVAEVLWHRFVHEADLHSFVVPLSNLLGHPALTPANISEQHVIMVKDLEIPEVLKENLREFLGPMFSDAVKFLNGRYYKSVVNMTDVPEAIHHFLRIRWNNFGLIDFKAMLKSYVQTASVVNFEIWKELCYYSLDDEIMRFGKTVDWENCRDAFDQFEQFCWYHKIFGVIPSKEMIATHEHSCTQITEADMEGDGLCNKWIEMLPSPAAVKYLRQDRTDEDFCELVKDKLMPKIREKHFLPEEVFSLLRFLEEKDCRFFMYYSYLVADLISWPWIRFMDHWSGVLETADFTLFTKYFETLKETRDRNNYVLDEMYKPFDDIWTVFYRRFRGDFDRLREVFEFISENRIITFCMVIFRVLERNHGRLLIAVIRNVAGYDPTMRRFHTNFLNWIYDNDLE